MAIPKKPLIIAVSIVLMLLVGTGVTAYVLRDDIARYFNPTAEVTDDQPAPLTPVVSKEVRAASTSANEQLATGNTEAAVAVLDDAITSNSSDVDKAALYIEKSNILFSSDLPAAIVAAEQAVELDPTIAHLTRLADYYAQDGQNERAIARYEEALALYDQQEFFEEGRQSSRENFLEAIEALR